MGLIKRTVATTAVVGVGALAYATFVEPRAFQLRRYSLPLLRHDGPDLRILHLSDLHLTPRLKSMPAWIRHVAETVPIDLVVVTGDALGHRAAVGPALDAFAPLIELPGVFVPGSNDYYAPQLRNPVRYLQPDDGRRSTDSVLPWEGLRAGLVAGGWHWLDNKQAIVEAAGRTIDVRGLDDPHLDRDDLASVEGPIAPDTDLVLGVTHAPYLRVLDAYADSGADLVLAGHTHGGQLCVPGYGALVTNCDLPAKYAKGLYNHAGTTGRTVAVEISAGLGCNLYTPVRFACRPEASLVTVTAG